MSRRAPHYGNEDESDRREWADWTERQRTAWGSPTRWVEALVGRPARGWGLLAILALFLVFLAISFLVGDTPTWRGAPDADELVERVASTPVHGLEDGGITYEGLLREYARQHGFSYALWDGAAGSDVGYSRVEWRSGEATAPLAIGFQVTDDRHHRVRVERLTLDALEAVVREQLGDEAAARFRAAAELS